MGKGDSPKKTCDVKSTKFVIVILRISIILLRSTCAIKWGNRVELLKCKFFQTNHPGKILRASITIPLE